MHYLDNLSAVDAKQGEPWDFICTELITDDIRNKKTVRQAFYNNPSTRHSFYSGIEPLNPNQRLNKDHNPPHAIEYVFADYDTLHLSHERVIEGIKTMPHKPARIEQSLGLNWRLGFKMPFKILTNGDPHLTTFLLKRLKTWLKLDVLPCLDEQAFITPTRYLCNGCKWIDTGHGAVDAAALQAFLVEAFRDYDKFTAPQGDAEVPLDVVEKAIREKYTNFNWPGAFTVNSQGPTFWIPESTSPMSAIVKAGGMISFAAHANQLFTPWSAIIGPEFSKKWNDAAIYKATENIWYDGHDYWMKGVDGIYRNAIKDEVVNYLKVTCRLSATADKQTGLSQIDLAMNHIYRQSRITSAGSFVFQRPGLILSNGERRLNTYARKPTEPVGRKVTWADMPFLTALWRHMFRTEEQFWHFIAWLKYFYESAYNWTPAQGQNSFFAGVKNSGKTLTNCHVIPPLVGGGMDASGYILGESIFNAHLYEVPYWTIDDETVIGSPANMIRTSNMFKKIAANRKAMSHAKFQKQSMVDWMGRLGVTLNMDPHSMRIIGPQDDATLEKTNIFRCNDVPFIFPSIVEIARLVAQELPVLARLLLDIPIPDFVPRYGRYGFEAYHDSIILDRTNQSQAIAPFKELLIDALTAYFAANPEALKWKGSATQIVRLLTANPMNEHAMRGIKLDQVNRYLEQIQKEGLLHCESDSGRMKTREWTFFRKDFEEAVTEMKDPGMDFTQPTTEKTNFEK